MKCKKHGESPAVQVTCGYCGASYRVYKKNVDGLQQFECRSCGAPLTEESLTATRVAEKACVGCGELFCDDCVVDIRGSAYCERCASELIKRYRAESKEKARREKQRAREEAARLREQQRRARSRATRRSGCGCLLGIIAVIVVAVACAMLLIV